MQRREFLQSGLLAGISVIAVPLPVNNLFAANEETTGAAPFTLTRDVPTKLFDGKSCWAHPRVGIIAGKKKNDLSVVLVMSMLDLTGNDIFTGMYGMHSRYPDLTWTEPQRLESISVAKQTINGKEYYTGIGDLVPKWHWASKTLLATGHNIAYNDQWKAARPTPKHTSYTVYDSSTHQWQPWKTMELPEHLGFTGSGAGCTQRIDLPDGTILLPVSYKPEKNNSGVTVLHCSFDGTTLRYLTHGSLLRVEDAIRGLGEPSLTKYNNKYFLTIRHDQRGYVTRSEDGLNFEALRPWTFDDGTDLGNYNTQQHWVTHSEGLFLVYTRRGANNDHVFRHRAPMFMAQVDTEKLCVLRDTETILMPERGARLGNFGVTTVSEHETWVTDSEWMQPKGCEKYGSDGSVYIARIHWNKPNALLQ